MKNKNKKNNSSTILVIGSFILLVAIGYIIFDVYSKNIIDNSLSSWEQEINYKVKIVDKSLIDSGNDVLFLSQVPPIQGIIRARDNNEFEEVGSSSYKVWVERLNVIFSQLGEIKQIYSQLRYIDEKGNEMVRVDFKSGDIIVVSEDDLQNKADTSYFKNTIKLKEGEVFISSLDLNLEHGEIENQGTEANPNYIPVIRYSTPIFDDSGNTRGMVILNVRADSFLEEIQKTNKEIGKIFLINAKGFYLSHPNSKKEFEFMFDKKASFYEDYPEELTEVLLANKGKTYLETEELIVIFKYIYPVFESVEEINFQNIPQENYFWVLAIVLEKDEINEIVDEQ